MALRDLGQHSGVGSQSGLARSVTRVLAPVKVGRQGFLRPGKQAYGPLKPRVEQASKAGRQRAELVHATLSLLSPTSLCCLSFSGFLSKI